MKLQKLVWCSVALGTAFSISTAKADIVSFDVAGVGGIGLTTTNELHGPSGSATGGELGSGIVFDTVTNVLSINVGWGTGNGFSDLTGNATAMHIHGPADINSTAGVLFNLGSQGAPFFNNSASSGGFNGSVTLSAAQETFLFDGDLYLNVHTSSNSTGEIRGNLFAVPEPNSLLLVGGLVMVGGYLKRRNK